MTVNDDAWPSEALWKDLVRRLRDGDPVAPSDLAVAFLDPLARWVEQFHPGVDPHVCSTAAEDAILGVIKNPRSFDPNRQTLPVYLRMSASGDLKNALRSEARHRDRRSPLDLVELFPVSGNQGWRESDPAETVERSMELEAALEQLPRQTVPESVRSGLRPEEAKVLELMWAGERDTNMFAEVLGIEDIPVAQQRLEVKRVKDRLKRRLERAGKTDA